LRLIVVRLYSHHAQNIRIPSVTPLIGIKPFRGGLSALDWNRVTHDGEWKKGVTPQSGVTREMSQYWT